MGFRLPLIDDELLSREQPTAKLELTEADLRMIAVALSHAAVSGPMGWDDATSARLFDQDSRRFKRVADELRREARTHNENGAATAGTAPRHDSLEVPR
jgi:hypothetical protein